jgi:hypothetical protein
MKDDGNDDQLPHEVGTRINRRERMISGLLWGVLILSAMAFVLLCYLLTTDARWF